MKFSTFLALALGAGVITSAATAQMAMPGSGTGPTHAAMDAMPGDKMAGMPGHETGHETGRKMNHGVHHGMHHGPIGVTGRHVLPQGRFMLAYRLGHMEMQGNRIGTTDVDPAFIATTAPNRFFGVPGQPPTLRVVPSEMSMSMHMLGAMYGATDRLTLSAMVPYVTKSMSSVTFAGPAGTTVLGGSSMSSEGLGDIRIGALYQAARRGRHSLMLGLGLSLPTGSISETGPMLSPTGMRMVRRMAYGMQLGSGTVDVIPVVTWQGGQGRWNWGAQARGVIHLGSNSAGYSLGDEAALTAWSGFRPARWVALSGRVEAKSAGHIDGMDPMIVMPTQGADPLNYGGKTIMLFAGADFSVQRGPLKGHKLGVELGVPAYQDLNGVQMKRDWSVVFAWRRGF